MIKILIDNFLSQLFGYLVEGLGANDAYYLSLRGVLPSKMSIKNQFRKVIQFYYKIKSFGLNNTVCVLFSRFARHAQFFKLTYIYGVQTITTFIKKGR